MREWLKSKLTEESLRGVAQSGMDLYREVYGSRRAGRYFGRLRDMGYEVPEPFPPRLQTAKKVGAGLAVGLLVGLGIAVLILGRLVDEKHGLQLKVPAAVESVVSLDAAELGESEQHQEEGGEEDGTELVGGETSPRRAAETGVREGQRGSPPPR